jgi:hypothetical protein
MKPTRGHPPYLVLLAFVEPKTEKLSQRKSGMHAIGGCAEWTVCEWHDFLDPLGLRKT